MRPRDRNSASHGRLLEFFCRHLIGIGWYEGTLNAAGEFTTKPTFWSASGFVLRLHSDVTESWALITAGHVIAKYKKRLSRPKMGAKHHSLFDVWGPHSDCDHRIPFNLFDTPALVKFDKDVGVDFAVVPLPGLVRDLISQTTTPFTKKNWIHQSNVSFDFFAMLGLPNETAEQFTHHKDGMESITSFQHPALMFLESCELPTGITPATNPQFVARIDPRVGLVSPVGMSGGPILGFRKNTDGQFAYWPVAIQSRWVEQSRIVIGTFIPPIAASIEQFLAHNPTTRR